MPDWTSRRCGETFGSTGGILIFRFAVLSLLVLAGPAAAQHTPSDSAVRWVDSIFAPFNSTRSPGCAVGITRAGQVALAKGYGMADLEHDRHTVLHRVDLETVHRDGDRAAGARGQAVARRFDSKVGAGGSAVRRGHHAQTSALPHERTSRLLHAAGRVRVAERRSAHGAAVSHADRSSTRAQFSAG